MDAARFLRGIRRSRTTYDLVKVSELEDVGKGMNAEWRRTAGRTDCHLGVENMFARGSG